jgi:hypothetical protein
MATDRDRRVGPDHAQHQFGRNRQYVARWRVGCWHPAVWCLSRVGTRRGVGVAKFRQRRGLRGQSFQSGSPVPEGLACAGPPGQLVNLDRHFSPVWPWSFLALPVLVRVSVLPGEECDAGVSGGWGAGASPALIG